ncbi:hypothetical protein [Cobetia sp. ICG0124]|uniref:hypothetical protein n=1 Tax=Cobetia sp. ICG0124 TaxID=2053669 RepID=UPI000FD8239C|nr:hypothetical protein [Cobetia sp. ICG0124]AZV31527.1 hypothetical protein CU110_09375 [Cobetia sp. ICG0124]
MDDDVFTDVVLDTLGGRAVIRRKGGGADGGESGGGDQGLESVHDDFLDEDDVMIRPGNAGQG